MAWGRWKDQLIRFGISRDDGPVEEYVKTQRKVKGKKWKKYRNENHTCWSTHRFVVEKEKERERKRWESERKP